MTRDSSSRSFALRPRYYSSASTAASPGQTDVTTSGIGRVRGLLAILTVGFDDGNQCARPSRITRKRTHLGNTVRSAGFAQRWCHSANLEHVSLFGLPRITTVSPPSD